MSAKIIETSDFKNEDDSPEEPEEKDENVDDAGNILEVREISLKESKKSESLADEDLPQLPEIKSSAQAKAILEALLFTTNDPLSVKKLSQLLNGIDENIIRQLLLTLQIEYDNEGRGIMIQEIAGGYIMATRRVHSPWLAHLHKHRQQRNPLTPAALETLAIIAYKQPITRADIDTIRGVESSAIIRTLLDLQLIEVVGKKDVIGKPQIYGTTKQFLQCFGLKSLSNLPGITELKLRNPVTKE